MKLNLFDRRASRQATVDALQQVLRDAEAGPRSGNGN